jgi:pimeloyl-ACP methyl ester carboxylesterase
LILLDKRGTGLSDRPRDLGSLETRMDDIRAVLDAVGAEHAIVLGSGAGGQPCAMFAATYPERTRALILVNTPARAVKTED